MSAAEILAVERGFGDAAVHLERAGGGDDDGDGRLQPGLAAFDVEEFLGPEIGAEARLGDDVIGELQPRSRRDDRIAAVRDVGEGAAVHDRRDALQGLHEVRAHREPQQRRHRASRLEIAHGDRLLRPGVSDHHAAEPLFEIRQIVGEAERRHHLGGDGDVEPVLARKAVGDAAEAADDLAQGAVVEVNHAPPDDPPRIDVERVAPIDVVVEHRREQVVRRGDRVKIAGEVEIDLLHRRDLRIAAAGGAAFLAEAGSERRFAQADRDPFADARQRVAEADRRRRLAFARRGRIDGGDEDELAVGLVAEPGEKFVVDLGGRASVGVEGRFGNVELGADRVYGREGDPTRDLAVRLHSSLTSFRPTRG